MSANEKLVAEMFLRSLNMDAQNIDLVAVGVMCTLINEDRTIIDKVIHLILEKINPDSVEQSIRALDILGECVAKCGEEFQKRIAKFNFLNELIKLVSKKYSGKTTPSELRNKIMNCLLLWVEEYPDRTKIKEAYDALCKEGVEHKSVATSLPDTSASNRKCSFLDPKTDEKIKALIKSGNREDAKRANLLIQYYVEQDTKRTELLLQQKYELKKAEDTISLLNEMIDRYVPSDAKDSLQDLYNHCLQLCPIIQRMPQIIDYREEETLAESLNINDKLTEVIAKYKSLSIPDDANETVNESCELLPDISVIRLDNADAIDSTIKTENNEKKDGNIDVLKDIFFDIPPVPEDSIPLTPLKPVAVLEEKKNEEPAENSEDTSTKGNDPKKNFFSYVDRLSDNLFKENLKDNVRIGKFEKKTEKVSLNEMKRRTSDETLDCENDDNLKPNSVNNSPDSPQKDSKIESTLTQNLGILDCHDIEHLLYNLDVNAKTNENTLDFDDEIKTAKSEVYTSEDEELISNVVEDATIQSNKSRKNLIDISLDSSIKRSSKLPKVNVMNDCEGLMMTFGFAEYCPSVDVFVIIISIANRGSIPIKNFHLEAGVSKPCKLRMLAPSRTHLDGADELLQIPVENIKQILLLYNPTKTPVDITFIISYNLSDDVDPIKEPVVAKDVPYPSVELC